MAGNATEQASAIQAPIPPRIAEESSPPEERVDRPSSRSWKPEYIRALRWCGTAALIGWGTEHMLLAAGVDPSWFPKLLLAVGVGLAVFAFVAVRKYRHLANLLVSNPFIVSVLSLITFATILGTLIPQRIDPVKFDHAYGSAAGFMRALHLDDIFHSLWLSGLIALAATSLMAIAMRRWPWTFPKWGYVAAHFGPVAILLGAVIGQIGGVKGRVDLEVGRSANEMLTQDWRTGEVHRAALPFAIRLDDFHIESHDPVYRIFVFRHQGTSDENASFEPVLSISPTDEQGKRVVVDKHVSLQVESYAEGAEPTEQRHMLQVAGLQLPVQPGMTYQLGERQVRVGAYYPHFTYDIGTKKAGNVSDQPVNPALQVEIRKGGATGEVEYAGWLFANMPGFSMTAHQEGGAEQDAPVYRLEGGGASGPAVKLAVYEGGEKVDSRDLLTQNGRHTLGFGDGKYVAVFRNRDTEAKNYFSKLSVMKEGEAVTSRQIFVNDPFTHGGYTFYQANFDPGNLRYSGIDVVRDPGLWFVYAGLVLMLFGVLHIFYLRTLGRRGKAVSA